jgi:heptosyltransferase-3
MIFEERNLNLKSPLPEIKSVGLMLLRQIGDVVLLTPTIQVLRERFPQAEITAIVDESTAPVLLENPHLTRVIPVPRRFTANVLRYLGGNMAVLRTIFRHRFDALVDFTAGDRSALYSWLSRAPIRITFAPSQSWKQWKRKVYTNYVMRPTQFLHISERFSLLLSPLGISTQALPFPALFLSDEEKIVQKENRSQIGREYAVVHFTAAWLFKCWEPAKAAEMIDWLQEEMGIEVCFTCGAAQRERDFADKVLTFCRGQPRLYWGTLSLRELVVLLSGSRLFLGIDGGPMHLAAAVGIPVVSIFGPTNPDLWAPRSPIASVVAGECPCRLGGAKACDWNVTRTCLKNVSTATVKAAVAASLQIARQDLGSPR